MISLQDDVWIPWGQMHDARVFGSAGLSPNGDSFWITGGEGADIKGEYILSGITNFIPSVNLPTPDADDEYRYHAMVCVDLNTCLLLCGDFYQGNYVYYSHSTSFVDLPDMITARRGCHAGQFMEMDT